jgi:hypothetical protein
MDYYERVATSLRNIVEAWQAQAASVPGEYETPMPPEEYEELRSNVDARFEDAKEAIETERAYRRHGARGAEPWIDPADADCLRPDERERYEVIDWVDRLETAKEQAEAEARSQFKDSTQTGLDQWS